MEIAEDIRADDARLRLKSLLTGDEGKEGGNFESVSPSSTSRLRSFKSYMQESKVSGRSPQPSNARHVPCLPMLQKAVDDQLSRLKRLRPRTWSAS